MEIKEVSTPKEIRKFIRFPKELYRDCPYYVPALDQGEYNTLTKHPALAFCDLKMWMAYQNGKVVGRIAGIINHKCNEIKQQKRIRFAWFDTVDDMEVARALFQKVEEWGRQNQLTEIVGPSRFSNMEKQAMLIEGFDHTVSIGADYNFPYYPQLMEQFGFEKEVDYIQYRSKVGEIPEKFTRLATLLSEKYRVKLRKFKNKEELRQCGMEFFQLINQSYADIFNFIPLTEEEIRWTINDNFKVANVDLSSVLEDENGRIVGFAFCLPSLSEAFQKAKGKLFPLGWYYISKALKNNKLLDMYITGVLPEYKNSGIHAIYHRQLHENSLRMGFEYALASQQLEDNVAARVWNKYDSEIYFKRRCYKKGL